MALVVVVIVAVWAILFGTALLARGLGRVEAVSAVVAVYLVLAGLALGWFGVNRTGFLGAFGMLLPCAAAVGLVLVLPRRTA